MFYLPSSKFEPLDGERIRGSRGDQCPSSPLGISEVLRGLNTGKVVKPILKSKKLFSS